MASLAASMEKLVSNIQSSTEAREIGKKTRISGEKMRHQAARQEIEHRKGKVCKLRSASQNLIERFGLEHRDMAVDLENRLNSEERARVEAARKGTERRKVEVSELRSASQNLIERFGLEHRDMAQNLRNELSQKVVQLKEYVGLTRDKLAADFRQARSIWTEVQKKKIPGIVATEKAAAVGKAKGTGVEVKQQEGFLPSSEAERVLEVIQSHSEGIRLLEIGNELGVDWRGLTKVVKSLVDAEQVEKMDDVYYPSQAAEGRKKGV